MSKPTDLAATVTSVPSSTPGDRTSLQGGETQNTTPFESGRPVPGTIPFGPPATAGEVGTLGPYRIVKELGRGGMGAVFLAFDSRLDRKLAMKVMLPESAAHPDARERFLREARTTAKVEHDNVVTIFEASEHNGIPYIAMPFLQGCSLDDYLKKFGNLSIPQIVRIGRETAAGLAAAHARGLIHRDIKPANLWLEAPNGRVKVLDFGLARPVSTDGELTGTGIVVGTPAFMSPEQSQGEKLDHRTDIFSLGSVLYRLCAGTNPFTGPSVLAILAALGAKEPAPLREANPDVPEPLANIIHKLLAKNPDERPQTAVEVARWFEAFEEHLAGRGAAAAGLAQPQVIYVPIPIAAQSESNTAFENLAPTEVEVGARSSRREKPVASKPGGKGMLIGAGVALFAAVVVAGVIFSGMGTRDSQAKKDAEPVPEKKDKPKVTPNPPVVLDPERKAAEHALSLGGKVRVSESSEEIVASAGLPRGKITLVGLNFETNMAITDDSMQAFKDCKNITHLDISATKVADAGLRVFRDCKNLTWLGLNSSFITDEGLAMFAGRTNIEYLHLNDTYVTNAGLAYFKDCKKLTHLHLSVTTITDEGLKPFEGIDTLKVLHVGGTPVTDKGLLYFKNCKNLEHLVVNSTAITDAGLAPFKDCKGLTWLFVSKSKVSPELVAEFRRLYPDCEIESDFRKKKDKK